MSRLCPNCSLPLDSTNFGGISLEDCAQCGGIWFDDGELQRVKVLGTGAFVELDSLTHPDVAPVFPAVNSRDCPACQTRMTSYHYLYSTPVLLDECSTCGGVWVDGGELTAMAKYVEDAKKPSPEDLKALAYMELASAKVETERNLARIRGVEQFCRMLTRRAGPFHRW